MLRRNVRSAFVAGAYVFPGGALDPEDGEPAVLDRLDGLDLDAAARQLGREDAAALWVAAIREPFEEAGVLLARDAQDGGLVGEAPTTVGWLDADRRALLDGGRTLLDIVVERDLVLDAGALAPVARWITPPGAPRRYDTWFFVTAAPDGHAYVHDDDETVASEWLTPSDALARAREREIDLIYPTFRSLQVLARFDDVSSLLDAIAARWQAASPWRDESPGNGWMLDLPKGEDDDREAAANSVRTGRRARAANGVG